jgi:hypothetical protein
MLIKIIVAFLVLIIFYCLGSSLFFMLSEKKSDKSMVKALTWRVILSLSVFILLMLGYFFGLLNPHPIMMSTIT